jgi:MFS family permease
MGFAWAKEVWHFYALFACYGIYMAMNEGNSKAFVVDLVDSRFRATGIGILGTFTGVATFFASLIAGILWDSFGSLWTFVYGALGAFIALLLLTKVKVLRGQFN